MLAQLFTYLKNEIDDENKFHKRILITEILCTFRKLCKCNFRGEYYDAGHAYNKLS